MAAGSTPTPPRTPRPTTRPCSRRGPGWPRWRRSTPATADGAFCAVRPPGHHATPTRAMGFCLFNNVAVTAAALAERGERVLIVDYDAHHGNGTQDVFWADGRVAYVSYHQFPLYPGTGGLREVGAGDGAGHHPQPAAAGGRHRRRLPGGGRRGPRALRGDVRPHVAAAVGRLRRPPRRPAHRPRAVGGRLRRPHRRAARAGAARPAHRVPGGRLRPRRPGGLGGRVRRRPGGRATGARAPHQRRSGTRCDHGGGPRSTPSAAG